MFQIVPSLMAVALFCSGCFVKTRKVSGTSATVTDTSSSSGTTFSNTYSLYFDGVDEHGWITSFATVLGNTPTQFTISLWLKMDEDPANGKSPLGAQLTTNSTYDTAFFVFNSATQFITLFNTALGGVSSAVMDSVTTGAAADHKTWHHLVLVFEDGVGAEIRSYRDATVMANIFDGGDQTLDFSRNGGSGHIEVGRYNNSDAQNMMGWIDEVTMWDTALTAAEVTEIYNSGTPTDLSIDSGDYVSSANLAGWWRMGDSDLTWANTVTDETINNNSMTLVNMETGDFQTDVP